MENLHPISAARARDLIGVTAELAKKLDKDSLFPIQSFGYVGDGLTHPLSSVTSCQGQNTAGWTLAQWKTLFPRAEALTEEVDRHAIQRFIDVNPRGCTIELPPTGSGRIDKTLEAIGGRHIWIKGTGRGVCGLTAVRTTLYSHGTSASPTSGELKVTDCRFTAIGQCPAVLDIWFDGTQTPMCFVGRDCVSTGAGLDDWFDSVIITRKYIRGWKLDNWAAYARHFYVLGTSAFVFPTIDATTHMGNSTASADCMTVGYAYALEYGFDGFTRSDTHCHEEGNHVNLQAYAGRGLIKARNRNRNFTYSDNWTFSVFGWQGTGPCFDLEFLEFVRARDGLMVHDALGGEGRAYPESGAAYARIFNCKDVRITDCALFLVEAATGLNAIYVGGDMTAGVEISNNSVTNYTTADRFLLIGPDVKPGQVLEIDNKWYGNRPANGYTDDQSNAQYSRLRVGDVMVQNGGTLWVGAQFSMDREGFITLARPVQHATDPNGDVQINFPAGLFRAAPQLVAYSADINGNNGAVVVDYASVNSGGFIAHCMGSNAKSRPANSPASTHVQARGR